MLKETWKYETLPNLQTSQGKKAHIHVKQSENITSQNLIKQALDCVVYIAPSKEVLKKTNLEGAEVKKFKTFQFRRLRESRAAHSA